MQKGCKRISFATQPTSRSFAERRGFEPLIRFRRIRAFQARLFNHSSTSPRMGKDNDFSGNRPNFAPTNSPSGTIFSGHCRQKTLPHASEPGRNGIHSPWLPPIRRQAKGRVPYSRRTAYTDPTRTIPTQKRISRRKRYNAVAPATCPQPSASTPDAAEYNGP